MLSNISKPDSKLEKQIYLATIAIIPQYLSWNRVVKLMMSASNYPFQVNILPLIEAIAAGNCGIIKSSKYTPHTSCLLAKIIGKIFDENYIPAFESNVKIS